MGIRNSFAALTAVVEQCETSGTVESVRPVEDDLVTGDAVRARVELAVPAASAPTDVIDDGDDDVAATLVATDRLPDGVSVVRRATEVHDETARVTLAVTSPRGVDCTVDADGEPPLPRRDDRPVYDDVPFLQAVYDRHDTFAEMADAVDVDVSAETVRRYMIDAGVHQPTTYDTGHETDVADVDASGDASSDCSVDEPTEYGSSTMSSDAEMSADDDGPATMADDGPATVADDGRVTMADDDRPVAMADGVGLPADVTVDQLVDAVDGSRTLFEVQRRLDLDRTRTRRVLERFDLLELVVGRLADARDVGREDVEERIRAG